MRIDANFKKSLEEIKLFLVDVDGVVTDGGIYYFDNGVRGRRFHMHDGRFSVLEKETGIVSGFCTGENDPHVKDRAQKLKIMNYSLFGCKNKLEEVKVLLDDYGWTYKNLAYVGDDIPDLELLNAAGLGMTVHNAVPAVRNTVKYVTERDGGNGAVREIIDCMIEHAKR